MSGPRAISTSWNTTTGFWPGTRSTWWTFTAQQGPLHRHRRVRQGAPDGRRERYYLGSKQEGVLAWSRIELATILQKQGARTSHDQARSGGSLPSSRGGADSVTLGPLAPRHGRGPRGPEPTRRGAAAPGRGQPSLPGSRNLRFLARVHETRARVLERQGHIQAALHQPQDLSRPVRPSSSGCGSNAPCRCVSEFDLARKELENQTPQVQPAVAGGEAKQLQERRWQYLVVACCWW